MNESDLCYAPATRLGEMLASGELSSVELTRAVIARIESLEPTVNAMAAFTPELALAGAERADRAHAAGESLGPLHGLPVTVKDLAPVADLPMSSGSCIFDGHVPRESAPFVDRLLGAGAVLLGKTTTSEFGWTGVSRSPLTGITSNPWRAGYNAGASSAGAGAGAAAGYGPLHQGSDGAGSIRMPAHFSGVYGLKPTYGRVPNAPVRNNDQVSHVGPLTRTVADSALMMHVMSGPHPLDHYSLESPPADYPARLGDGIAGLRVAFSPDLGHARVDEEVAALVADAVAAFAELGCEVERPALPFGADGAELVRFMWAAHELELAGHLPEWEGKMDPGLVACIRSAEQATASEYIAVRARKLDYVRRVHRFFDDWDLLLTPAVSVPAFPAERLQPEHWPEHPWDWLSWAEFSYPFNFSANPAASIPCGFTADGLPVGLQIVGRRFEDLTVLRASAAFEAVRPWAQHRPLP